jgi:putative DNA primase/helicase
MHPIMVAHLAKYASLMPSLALIYQLVDHERGPVCLDSAERAIAMCDYLEEHAARIFAPRITPDVTAAKQLLERVHEGKVQGPFEPRDIYRKGWTGLDKDDVNGAVDCLEEFGWVQVTGRKPGEKKRVYLHPSLRGSKQGQESHSLPLETQPPK